MSKRFKKASATKPAKPRNSVKQLAASVNVALQQIAQEMDEIKRVIGAVVNATDSEAKVMELLGRQVVENAVDTVVPDEKAAE